MAHDWMHLVLRILEFPLGFRNLVHGMYFFAAAFAASPVGMQFLYWYGSGVLQGCPLSGSIFAIIMNPFLVHFENKIEIKKKGVVRACADDIGMVLRSVSDLVSAHAVFSRAKRFAGLALKPAKCNLVPLAAQWSDKLSRAIHHRLANMIGEWQAFQVLPCCRYLGFYLGPAAGQMQWASPLSKWASRSELIAATGCPPLAAACLYNSRAVTTLSYVGQLVPLISPRELCGELCWLQQPR